MKWIFGLISLGFLFTSCDNELVVTADWKDIPVVWGLLSKSDTAHYVRVEKAYLDPAISALALARIPDSLYYDDAVVTLKRISSGQVFTLTRVDGDVEGYPREGGIFAETPNYLYKIKANVINLMIGEKYEFGLLRNGENQPVTAETIILPKPVLRNPNPGSLLPFRANTTFVFTWNAIPDAGIFDLHLTFHYKERSAQTGNLFKPQSVQWTIARSVEATEILTSGSDFYNSLKAFIAQDITATRIFDSIDLVLWCGGKELAEFIKITQANTGITSTQEVPGYTNLSEGIGIFTSRNYTSYTGFGLTNQALDSLKNSSTTKLLNFQ